MELKKRIQTLCREHGISMNQLEQELGFGKGYISKLGKSTPNVAKIQQIAQYFAVTVDSLMSEEKEKQQNFPGLTLRDERDIAKDLNNIMEKLRTGQAGPASFNGTDIPQETQELFAQQLDIMLHHLKKINKEKYNPYKNKK